jgi:NADPH:quinone reductase
LQAIVIHETGGPEVLRYEQVPLPEPGPGEARIKVEAAGLNFIDIYYRTGQYQARLPVIPGQEAAGVVDTVGPGVTEVQVGERVVVYHGDLKAYAEYAVAPAWKMVAIPREVSSQQAAAVILQGMTAQYLAVSTFPVKPGDETLVHAAAGGVGQLLVQIVKLRGGRVIATASTAAKLNLARGLGADDLINYVEQDFEPEVKRLTEGRGVDVVYDSVGKDTFDRSLNCLRPRGYMVLYGQSSGRVPPIDPQTLNAKGSLFLTRPTLAHYVATRAELLQRANDLFEWIAEGKVKVRIDRTFPLSQALEAHRYLASRAAMGKVLLIP